MADSNATLLICWVRQDTRYQILQALKRNEIDASDYLYTEVESIEPGVPTSGRFEIILKDGVDVQRVVEGIKKFGSGYQPPDVKVMIVPIQLATNA